MSSQAQAGDRQAMQDAVNHRRQAAQREPDVMRFWALLALDEQQLGDTGATEAAFRNERWPSTPGLLTSRCSTRNG